MSDTTFFTNGGWQKISQWALNALVAICVFVVLDVRSQVQDLDNKVDNILVNGSPRVSSMANQQTAFEGRMAIEVAAMRTQVNDLEKQVAVLISEVQAVKANQSRSTYSGTREN